MLSAVDQSGIVVDELRCLSPSPSQPLPVSMSRSLSVSPRRAHVCECLCARVRSTFRADEPMRSFDTRDASPFDATKIPSKKRRWRSSKGGDRPILFIVIIVIIVINISIYIYIYTHTHLSCLCVTLLGSRGHFDASRLCDLLVLQLLWCVCLRHLSLFNNKYVFVSW